MGVDAMRIVVQIKKVLFCSKRTCLRSVCSHPFLVGFVCYLIFLHRSSPSVFSLLVSASPVLVCTAVLLGTLLSFGQANESEKEGKVTAHEIASLKTGVVKDNTVVNGDENESFATIERYIGKGKDIAENDLDESILVESRGIEVQEYVGLGDHMPLIDVNSREIQCMKQLTEKVERNSNDLLELEKNGEVHKEKPRIEGKLIDGEVIDNQGFNNGIEKLVVEDYHFPEEKDQLGSAPGSSLIDAVKEDHFASAPGSYLIDAFQLGSAPGSSWRRVEEDYGEVDGADGDKSMDSRSDGAESSSPDASIADIMPMLYELHPILEMEDPHMSHDGSDAGLEMLNESDDRSVDYEEDTSKQGEGKGEDDHDEDDDGEEGGEDGDDNDEGEEVEGENEEESKSAIKWTEIDQKNLMDLGTSELERNQRLENIIARRARKNMRLMAEKKLIDMESSGLPYSILPIAKTRRNPFELPDDIYDDMAIPGSAPSILLPSRNPFDLHYNLNEEKPDEGESFQQGFSEILLKEPVYRRNETFSIGPSVFRDSRHERQDFKWRPYFVPERLPSDEGTGYPTFQRQLSEVSESNSSSVRDSESVNSAADEEDKKSREQAGFSRTESTPLPHKENESHLKAEPGEEYSSRSSYSSLSEGDENIPDAREEEDSKTSELEFQFMSEVVEHWESVYDSSPPWMERFLSFTSISSDTQLEISEITSLPGKE